MALGMVKRLVRVLKKHRVHGIKTGRSDAMDAGGQGAKEPDGLASFVESSGVVSAVQDLPQWFGEQGPGPKLPDFSYQPQQNAGEDWARDTMDPNLPQMGIWDDFLGIQPTTSGWEQLFIDLETLGSGI